MTVCREKRNEAMKGICKILGRVLLAVIIVVVLALVGFFILQSIGGYRFHSSYKGQVPSISGEELLYNGNTYCYNEDILTFLLLGIDYNEEVTVREEGLYGGQSDAIFLLVLNPHNKEISVIAINRNAMVYIDVYDEYGSYIGVAPAQITLQHGYGDGAWVSCQRTEKVVSEVFYDLPIHGYCSFNMGGIPLLNNLVGGVEVTVLEDVGDLKEGMTTLLWSWDAYYYLRYRDVDSFGSADRRLERQKQYLAAYVLRAQDAMKKDLTLPVKLCNALFKYIVTDITVDELSYLVPRILDYHFDSANFYSIPGETVMGEEFEEFYIDEQALYELILQVFYEET